MISKKQLLRLLRNIIYEYWEQTWILGIIINKRKEWSIKDKEQLLINAKNNHHLQVLQQLLLRKKNKHEYWDQSLMNYKNYN